MIKVLPDDWYVYIPTAEVKYMVISKLRSLGYNAWRLTYNSPCFIGSCYNENDRFTDFEGAHHLDQEYTEIHLRKILEAEVKEMKEESLFEKIKKLSLGDYNPEYFTVLEDHINKMIDKKLSKLYKVKTDD